MHVEKDQTSIAADHIESTMTIEAIDPEISARIRRKYDLRIVPALTLLYLFSQIDRSNAGNARVLGLDKDLGLTGDRFNIGLSVFYIPYILLEIPANMMWKKFGPRKWLTFLTVSFGLCTTCMAAMQNYGGFVGARFVLGALEAGLSPGSAYTLSCFYTRTELASRLGLNASVAAVAGAFGGLLAAALVQVPTWGIIHTWRNIFFFEGIMSILVGIFIYYTIPDSPETARFLTAEEKIVASQRIHADLKTSKMEAINRKSIKRTFYNWNIWLISMTDFCALLTNYSMSLFLPSILVAMGYSGVHAQLMAVPPFVWAAIVCVSASILSQRMNRKGLWILIVMPFTAAGFIVQLTAKTVAIKYFGLFLCLTGSFTTAPLILAWSVDNTAGHATRALSSAFVISFANCAGILATWTYRKIDAPKYRTGHTLNLTFAVLSLPITVAVIGNLWIKNRNRAAGKEDYKLQGITEEEMADMGHEHPGFRFTL